MNEYYPFYDDYLEHYGVKGMRWGVRKDPILSYKDKQRKRVEKTYSKAAKTAKRLSELYPDDKSIQNEVKNLAATYKKDMQRINDMTYHDVVREKRIAADSARQRRHEIYRAVQEQALWAGRMGLLGLRAYGTLKAVEIIGTAGTEAIRYLQSDAGQKFVNDAVSATTKYLNLGDNAINKLTGMDVSADSIVKNAAVGLKEARRQWN